MKMSGLLADDGIVANDDDDDDDEEDGLRGHDNDNIIT